MSISKTQFVLTTLAITVCSSSAFSAPTMIRPFEVRERVERDLKRLNTSNVEAKKLENHIRQSMLHLSRGKVSTTEIDAALKKSFSVKEDGIAQTVNLSEMAKSIEATRTAIEKLERNRLDPESAELVKQLERGLEITPRFLALAALTSKKSETAEHVEAFAKEISLTRDILTNMKTEEIKSHLDVMEMALELKLRTPEMTGDQAFTQALKDKYGDKANEKIAELLKCVR